MSMVSKKDFECVEISVFGRVQGVFFRNEARKQAMALGITGWAQNVSDGSVGIVAEGERRNLQKFIEWCRKGTEYSEVERIEVAWRDATGAFVSFDIH